MGTETSIALIIQLDRVSKAHVQEVRLQALPRREIRLRSFVRGPGASSLVGRGGARSAVRVLCET